MTVRLIQVTNVSTSVTKEQLRALFAHLGRIEEIQLYPESETLTATIAAKVGYVKFSSSEIAQAALNLTNTIFLDRPILCNLVKSSSSSSSSSSRIPDELEAIKYCAPLNTNIALLPNGPTWPHNIINRKVTIPGSGDNQAQVFIETIDSNLAERSLPAYPPLPGTMDPTKAEEIRRTVYVSNLDPRVTLEHLHDLFSQVGEIKYIRMTKSRNEIDYENLGFTSNIKTSDGVDLSTDSVGAYVEFSEQPSIVKALCLNGLNFANRLIKVNHSTNSIIIPANSKEQISLEELRKESAKSSSSSKKHSSSSHHRHSSSRHSSHHHKSSSHRNSRHDKHGSASDSSSPSSEEEEESESSVDSEASSPPRKQRRSSRDRSESKSKTSKHQSSSKTSKRSSRSKEREREKEREKEKEKKERERDRDRERERDRDRDREKHRERDKEKEREKKDKDRDRDREREKEKERSSSSKKRKEEKSSSSSKKSRDKSKEREKRDKSRDRS